MEQTALICDWMQQGLPTMPRFRPCETLHAIHAAHVLCTFERTEGAQPLRHSTGSRRGSHRRTTKQIDPQKRRPTNAPQMQRPAYLPLPGVRLFKHTASQPCSTSCAPATEEQWHSRSKGSWQGSHRWPAKQLQIDTYRPTESVTDQCTTDAATASPTSLNTPVPVPIDT